jgi:hypothetical protein
MSSTTIVVMMMVFMMSCVLIIGGGAAAWWFWNKKGPNSPPFNNVTPPSVPGGGGGPPSSSVPGGPPSSPPSEPSVNIPVKTGDLTADVHILEESEAQLVNYDGFEVWTPKEILTPTNPRDHMSGYHANPNMTSVGPKGYVVKEWDPTKFWPEWAKEDFEKAWPRNKKYRFTCLYVRVLGIWYVVPRYDFLGEEEANKRLVYSARVLSIWYEGMKAAISWFLDNQGKIKAEYRFLPEEVENFKKMISGKAAWQSENLPTEWFGLGTPGSGCAHVFPHDVHTKDLEEFSDSWAWGAVHEDCHVGCVAGGCRDSCNSGHSTRWQQLEHLFTSWLRLNGVMGYKKFSELTDKPNCYIDTSKCNLEYSQPNWLPVENNANTACDVATNKHKPFGSFF